MPSKPDPFLRAYTMHLGQWMKRFIRHQMEFINPRAPETGAQEKFQIVAETVHLDLGINYADEGFSDYDAEAFAAKFYGADSIAGRQFIHGFRTQKGYPS